MPSGVAPPERGGDRLSVLHLVTSDAFAGIERHVVRLVSELQASGCAPRLACPPSAHEMRRAAKAAGVRVVPSEGRRGAWLAHVAATALRTRPHIVHVHDGVSALVGAVIARAAGARFVRTQHFSRPASAARRGWRGAASVEFHRRLNRRLDGFIAVSGSAVQQARRRGEVESARCAVIPPGIALPDDAAVAAAAGARERSPAPTVCMIGRFEPERRIDVLIRAIDLVISERPDCRFVIGGSGSADAELKELARSLGVEQAIEWAGWVPDPASVLGRSHVYVNTLPWEGFGMAMAEAMAFGLPVVAVNSGSSPELVEHGATGFLVAEGDSAALADAIVRLVGDRQLACSMGEAARRRATHLYGAARTARETLVFYEQLRRDGGS